MIKDKYSVLTSPGRVYRDKRTQPSETPAKKIKTHHVLKA